MTIKVNFTQKWWGGQTMQPTTARDFLRVALERLDVAIEIMDLLRRSLEAQYIGGYAVECSLKALTLEKTAASDKSLMLRTLTRGATYHRPEVVLDRLRELEICVTPELAKRMRRFDWHIGLRYETGRKDTGETNALLNTAKAIYEWAEAQIK